MSDNGFFSEFQAFSAWNQLDWDREKANKWINGSGWRGGKMSVARTANRHPVEFDSLYRNFFFVQRAQHHPTLFTSTFIYQCFNPLNLLDSHGERKKNQFTIPGTDFYTHSTCTMILFSYSMIWWCICCFLSLSLSLWKMNTQAEITYSTHRSECTVWR